MGQARPAVPDLRMQVQGTTFGGQYDHDDEFTLVAQASTSGGARITLLGSTDEEITAFDLSLDQAREVLQALEEPSKGVADVPGLEVRATWTIGTQERSVQLLDNWLGTITDWLSYATGEHTWDWKVYGDAFEY